MNTVCLDSYESEEDSDLRHANALILKLHSESYSIKKLFKKRQIWNCPSQQTRLRHVSGKRKKAQENPFQQVGQIRTLDDAVCIAHNLTE